VTAQAFRKQLQFLKVNYNVIAPEQFFLFLQSNEDLPPRSVLLTCDDGLKNTLTEMLPVLAEFNLKCLFCVTGASLDYLPSMLWHEELYLMLLRSNRAQLELPGMPKCSLSGTEQKRALWSRLLLKLSQVDANARRSRLNDLRVQLCLPEDWTAQYSSDEGLRSRFFLLNGEELQQLLRAGMTIGAHTGSHPVLSQLPDNLAWEEISQCRDALERALGQPLWALAYPFGDADSVGEREMQIVQQAGYTCAFVSVGGGFGAGLPRFAIPRVHVGSDMKLAEFEAHLSGFYRNLRQVLLNEKREFGALQGASA